MGDGVCFEKEKSRRERYEVRDNVSKPHEKDFLAFRRWELNAHIPEKGW